MPQVTIRAATVKDLETIADFNARLATESENTTLDPETSMHGVRAILPNPAHGSYYVACTEDGPVIAQIMHTREWSDWRNGDIWWIQSVFVHPAHRRKGVFRALYRHLHTLAISTSRVVGIRLYVERDNRAAQATYENLGMEKDPYEVMKPLFTN